jgi:cell division protein FtsZ
MPKVKPEIKNVAKIKVVGVGGGGSNAVSRMADTKIRGVEFVVFNTDAQDLFHSNAQMKIHIGKETTRGLGAGMNPALGKQAAEESREDIQEALKGSDMIFVTAGMGGGTGTGASPVIAEIAKDQGALVVGIVTKPFAFEGFQRAKLAEEGLNQLSGKVDTILVIPNDKIISLVDKKTPLVKAFKIVDEILNQAVQGISDLITVPGIVNVDFADIKAVMQGAGPALMGVGKATGENRAINAAKMAINSPLLEISIHGASAILFNVSGGSDMSMNEVNEAARIITESIDPTAKVIFGAAHDHRLKKGELKITVIATGFTGNVPQLPLEDSLNNNGFDEENNLRRLDVEKKHFIKTEENNESEEEWDVPAFLRRGKK